MKTLKLILCISIGMMICMFTACSSSKAASEKPHRETSLEGDNVRRQQAKLQGIEEMETLNDDGTSMIKMPYVYFVGTAKADNKRAAISLAQRNAYSTISLVLQNAVKAQAEQGTLLNNGKTQEAVKEYWNQVSVSLTKACMPLGDGIIEYNPATKMYDVTAKVGTRGDRFNKLLDNAGLFRPTDLQGEELKNFIEVNNAIIDAVKSAF